MLTTPMTAQMTSPATMPDQVLILNEPLLEFNFHQHLVDPHDGLMLFGPYGALTPSHPKSLPFGLIGTDQGIAAFRDWSCRINRAVTVDEDRDRQGFKKPNPKLWPAYPGFESAFCATWPDNPAWLRELSRPGLLEKAKDLDPYHRAFQVVNEYVTAIEIAKRRDEALSVIVCVVPEDIWINCRPASHVIEGTGHKLAREERAARQAGQGDLFVPYNPREYEMSVDFRRQIKARVMEYGVPIQIVRESMLRLTAATKENRRSLTPLPDRAWNLTTTLYYKAGGKPWRLAAARPGVCYIGIAFRRTDDPAPRSACCAAQMFLDSGDGIVFLGEFGPWYSPKDKQFHLSRRAARSLLAGVLKTYEEMEGRQLTEVFLHSRSDISGEEFEGYRQACPDGVKVVGVRVRRERHGVRLFRSGTRPVVRGTFWKTTDRTGYLWASGFKPRWETYDGSETPIPLRIDIQHGSADIEQVGRDIYALTKLNYNACKLGDAEPVTVGFSDAVGEILVSNPKIERR